MNKQNTPSLPVHEWLAIGTVVLLFLFLVFISQIYQRKDLSEFSESSPSIVTEVNVAVDGAVERPGSYSFPKGITLSKVLEHTGLKEDADIKGLKLKSKILHDQKIMVKTIPLITVYVEGTVKNKGAFTVPKDMTLKKILKKVSPEQNANLKLLGPLERKLVSGEIIKIQEK